MDEAELLIETFFSELTEELVEFFGSSYERFIEDNDVLETAFDTDCY